MSQTDSDKRSVVFPKPIGLLWLIGVVFTTLFQAQVWPWHDTTRTVITEVGNAILVVLLVIMGITLGGELDDEAVSVRRGLRPVRVALADVVRIHADPLPGGRKGYRVTLEDDAGRTATLNTALLTAAQRRTMMDILRALLVDGHVARSQGFHAFMREGR